MVGFTKKKLKSKTLGEKLKKLREELRVPLEEISRSIKVRAEYLEKIEKEEFDKLPPDVYVKGFLKNYAIFLGVDPQRVIDQYEKERGIQSNLKTGFLPKIKKRKFSFPNITITPKSFSLVTIFILFTVCLLYFYSELEKFSRDPRLVIVYPFSDISINNNSIDVIGITDKDNKIVINDQPVMVDEKGEFKEKIGLQNGINNINIKSINKFGKINEKSYNVSANYEVIVAGEKNWENRPDKEELFDKKLVLEISAKDTPIWVAIKIDDGEIKSETLLPNAVQTYEAKEKISITSGKANKTFIKINGIEIGMLDISPGVVRDIVFDKLNLNQFIEKDIQNNNTIHN